MPEPVPAQPVDVKLSATSTPAEESEAAAFFTAIGGHDTFARLVAEFYATVADDPVLRPLYPDDDLQAAQDRLRMFLVQYWGGPTTYSEVRGHPRLRMRHAPFAIGPVERDAWLHHMRAALDTLGLDEAHDDMVWTYLVKAAFAMQNQP